MYFDLYWIRKMILYNNWKKPKNMMIKITERRDFYNERIRRLEVAKASNPSRKDLVKRIKLKSLFY